MFPVKNFISFATIRKGSTLIPPGLVALDVALEKTFEATDTACAQDDCLLRGTWWYIEVEICLGDCLVVNWQLEHVEKSFVLAIEEFAESSEALLVLIFMT